MAVAMFNFGTGAVVSDPVLEFFRDAVRAFAAEFGGKDELRELAECGGVLTRESGRLRPDFEKRKGQSSGGCRAKRTGAGRRLQRAKEIGGPTSS